MWDTPYDIPDDGNNSDTCPLVNQWPKLKSKDIPKNREILSSPLLRILERFPLLEIILSKMNLKTFNFIPFA